MYSDDNISLEFYNKYYEFVHVLKSKMAPSSKLDDLIIFLRYVINKHEELNEDEKKLVKNIISMSKSIINSANTYKLNLRQKLIICKDLLEQLEEKQKEPIKK